MSEQKNIVDIILFSMDKICQINKYLSWEAAKKEGISLIQLQIIDHISRIRESSATVSGIAEEFELTKATISESVNNLVDKGYLEKKSDPHDRRTVYLSLTKNTKRRHGNFINRDRILKDILLKIPDLENLKIADFFLAYFKNLIDENIIQMVRMCIDCANFEENAKPESQTPHFCRTTKKYFSNVQMNTDCYSYLKAVQDKITS